MVAVVAPGSSPMEEGAPEAGSGGGSHTPWREHDWNAILAGSGTADRYFARPGLVRKDRLSTFAPPSHHPLTAVLRSFEELKAALQALAAQDLAIEKEDRAVRFVLKQAHSSNASGIRFISHADACAVLGTGGGEAAAAPAARAPWRLVRPRALAAPGLAACVAALASACLCKTSYASKRFALSATVLVTTLSLAVLREGGLGTTADPVALPSAGMTLEQSAVVADLRNLLKPTGSGGLEKATVWVLQRYVEPWLHDGRKFHLRVLFLCVGDLRAYAHEDVRVLLATEPFEAGERDGSCLLAHVTNMGVSRESPAYHEGSQNLPLAALGEAMARRVFGQVVEVLGATVAQVRAAGRRHFFTTPNCWELFGADFLVEATSERVVLLEINPSPSLAMYGSGSDLRAQLCGLNPLETILPSWHEVPLRT